MVQIRFHIPGAAILFVLIGALAFAPGAAAQKRFYPDDPLWKEPPPKPVVSPKPIDIDPLFDFAYMSFVHNKPVPKPAANTNTLGEVPDSSWYVNRHASHRMSAVELKRGPGNSNPPVPPFVVVGAKTEGVTPGFRIRDAKGRTYFVKPDPRSAPEQSTAADLIGSKFFYALGFYTAEQYLLVEPREKLGISPEAHVKQAGALSRPMIRRDLDDILFNAARDKQGNIRLIASLELPGKIVGPFSFEGNRSDDPNDLVPHQLHRELRGLQVFCAWINHTDAKSLNTLSTLVTDGGAPHIRHYMMDFGSAFGSDGDKTKDASLSNVYMIPNPKGRIYRKAATLGLWVEPWESSHYSRMDSVGRFESTFFDPEKWLSNYPNTAIISADIADKYWAAKKVMAFTDEDIRTIVELAQYSDPAATDYMVKTLGERRSKIGRAYYTRILALDDFSVQGGELRWNDLAVHHGFLPPRKIQVSWSGFDNSRGIIQEALPGQTSPQLPAQFASAPAASYFAAKLSAEGAGGGTVTVYIRKRGSGAEVVGVDRNF
jgi:hypothetical protein